MLWSLTSSAAWWMCSTIVRVGGILPSPTSPQASFPEPGWTISHPKFSTTPTLRWVMGLRHIIVFMAGKIMRRVIGRRARQMVDNTSSAMPLASLAMMLAVAGTITTMSAHFANSMWFTLPSSSSHRLVVTGCSESTAKGISLTKWDAALVMTTLIACSSVLTKALTMSMAL